MVSGAGLLARVVRGGITESAHVGTLAAIGADGWPRVLVGDVTSSVLPRSAVKPVQAVAMLRAGLDVDDEGLALACASHGGTDVHLAVVHRVLAGAGLDTSALENVPDLPLDPAAAAAWRVEGRPPSAIGQNCSGKHAAMLATCVAAGWDVAGYRHPDHPLQRVVRATLEDLTGVRVTDVTVDGCGAPLFSTTVEGLARAFGRVAAAQGGAEARVAAAMTARPDLVGGPGRPVTDLMAAVPGMVAKDGAEGVFALGLPDGAAVAVKVQDGGARPLPAILGAAVEELWRTGGSARPAPEVVEALARAAEVPVLGHGERVGEVVADPGGTW